MKYLSSLSLLLTILTLNISAQVSQTEIEYIQSKFGKDKKEIIADYVQLEEEKEINFWKIYDEYEVERKLIGKDRFDLVLHYANNQLVFDDKDLENEIEKFISLKTYSDKLIEEYYNKIRKESGVKIASKFYMIERYFQNVVRVSYMKQIPFMNELENK